MPALRRVSSRARPAELARADRRHVGRRPGGAAVLAREQRLGERERQLAADSIKQIGDIGFVVRAIVGAVFFALLFSVGATMMQSVRERTPELAVLKTLGFSDNTVLGLIVSESLLMCLVSATIGLALAALLFPVTRVGIGFNVHAGPVLLVGFAMAAALALISGLPPAVRGMRLSIVDALAGR